MKYHTGKFISTINEAQETQLLPCHSSVMQPSINNQPYGTPYLRKQVSQEKCTRLAESIRYDVLERLTPFFKITFV